MGIPDAWRPKTGAPLTEAIWMAESTDGFELERGPLEVPKPAFHFQDPQTRAIRNAGSETRISTGVHGGYEMEGRTPEQDWPEDETEELSIERVCGGVRVVGGNGGEGR